MLWEYFKDLSHEEAVDARRVYTTLRLRGWQHDDAATIAAHGRKTLVYQQALLSWHAHELWDRLLVALHLREDSNTGTDRDK